MKRDRDEERQDEKRQDEKTIYVWVDPFLPSFPSKFF